MRGSRIVYLAIRSSNKGSEGYYDCVINTKEDLNCEGYVKCPNGLHTQSMLKHPDTELINKEGM